MISISSLYERLRHRLHTVSNSPQSDALHIIKHSLGLKRIEDVLSNWSMELSYDKVKLCMLNLRKRLLNEPLSYITSSREFWSMEFYVDKNTLIPRHETEVIIEAFIDIFPDKLSNLKILDLGTGSGCIMLSILATYSNSIGTGVDLCEKALAVAEKNAKNLGLIDRTLLKQSDWFSNVSGKFDVIVSNPPYISAIDLNRTGKEVKDFEPKLALTDFGDGFTCYRKIAACLKTFLKEGGIGLFEIGFGQKEGILDIFESNNLKVLNIYKDINGIDRVISISNR
ncbi:Release factor glutamine methyltransferase [Candidatus Cyrtobacter comes]|uniref:Release factor glutamine methyltransferase n=1 Tax=Candidatus Cyrtobacter comes TaxID=675776 RepID=A0ABU5L714_9RICK|nr:peptide chain release factor N(5)-glutamine methyltransferase [Candidatus Cyrtobacter comes]MDZ5761916.1 Release factor glutamine methyltransferase [Candidatus Cyrtobacter comes]